MPARLLPALVGAALAVAGLTLPAGTAAADTSCAPVIDPTSVAYTPTTLVLSAKGKYATKHQQASAAVTAPCANENGSDLQVEVVLSPPGALDAYGVTDDEGAYPSDPATHAYGVFTKYAISAKHLRNAEAGTWATELFVTDTDGDSAHDYDEVDGPSIQVLRDSTLTSKAKKTVKLGKSVTITGTLSRADWQKRKDVAFAKQPVQLQFRPTGGAWTTFFGVTSSKKGGLKASVTPSSDGDYRFAFAGTTTTDAATSKARHIDVK